MKTTIRPDTSEKHLKKYKNKNVFHQLALSQFFDKIALEIEKMNPKTVFEFGCGEGLFLEQLKERKIIFSELIGLDLREDALQYARTLHPNYEFINEDVMAWKSKRENYDLVIASQVLEHLNKPDKFLERLTMLSNRYLLLTVPWEPWFRLMNLLRGRDLIRFGNHPEHINRWGKNSFIEFVETKARVIKSVTAFPFTIVVAEIRN